MGVGGGCGRGVAVGTQCNGSVWAEGGVYIINKASVMVSEEGV